MKRLTDVAVMFMILLLAPAAWAAPDRGLSAAFNHPGLILGPDDEVEMSLTLRNLGQADDSFAVTVVEKPEGWETELRSFASLVTGAFIPGLDQVGLSLRALPPEGERPAPGDYVFKVRAESLDGVVRRTAECRVTIRERPGGSELLTLTTAHPEVRGPSDGRFSFTLDVRNLGGEDGLVGLSAVVPAGWEAWFKPAYEDKQVSSIQIPKGQSRSLTLDVTPAYRAPLGQFPLKVRAESWWGSAETALTVELTGTYQIRLVAANELLSAATEPGQPFSMNFFVVNEGSAPQREVKFLTVAPDNWLVELSPPELTGLQAHQSPTPVTMTVTPSAEALVGDYGLGLAAEGERSKSALDLRITVRTKATWAWIGVGIIVLVVLGLGLTFRLLGRR